MGFTTGQIQLVSPQPGPREYRKLYNEDVSLLNYKQNEQNI